MDKDYELLSEKCEVDKDKKGISNFWWGCFGIFIIIFFIISFIGNDSQKENKTETNIEEEKEEVLTTKIYEYLPNETISFCGIEYKIKRTYIDKDYEWIEVSNYNNNFYIIELEVYNSTNETKNFKEGLLFSNHIYTYSLFCDEVQGVGKFDMSDEYLLSYDSIMAKETIECALVYEISEEVLNYESKNIYLEITFNKIADRTEIHKIKLRG